MEHFSLEDQAHRCGGTFRLTTEPGTFQLHGVDVPVEQQFFRCDGCGEEYVTEALASAVQRQASATFRRQEGYLTGGDIRALRERLGLTQETFEAALGLGAKSMARWENERVLQNRSVDDLLRLVDRDPTALVFLADRHGAPLPDGHRLGHSAAIDCLRWPRELISRLEGAAARQGADLHTYLIFLLTEFTVAGSFSARTQEQIERQLAEFQRMSGDEREPWQRDHQEAMRDAKRAQAA